MIRLRKIWADSHVTKMLKIRLGWYSLSSYMCTKTRQYERYIGEKIDALELSF